MRLSITITLLSLLFAGCPQDSAVKQPVLWGVVDQTLPRETRDRQDALTRLLKAIQSGTAIRHLNRYEPDLEFHEKSEGFFAEGIQLVRWDWARAPQGDKHYVTMEFLLDEPPGDKTVTSERTYVVSRAGRRFIIRRADSLASR